MRWLATFSRCCALACAAAALTGCGGTGGTSAAVSSWIEARPALADRSTWRMDVDAAERPDVRALGPVGVGNGKVFGLLGDGYPLATWHNLGGPTYHRPVKWFSDHTPYLVAEGGRRDPAHETLSYVRRTPVAIAESSDEELAWTLVAFAPRGAASVRAEDALVSVWIVRNQSRRTIANVGLEIGGVLARYDGRGLVENDTTGRHLVTRPIDGTLTTTAAGDNGFTIALGDLAPGEERVVPVALAFTSGDGGPEPVFAAVAAEGVEALLDATLAWWRDWFGGVTRVETPDRAFDDLFDAQVLAIKVNQAATGALSQMSQYAYTWLRDTHGPAIFYPRIGLADDFRDMLDYQYGAALLNGDLANALPADQDLSRLPPPPDWRSLPTYTWRTRAEGPSFVVLEYEAYERATGDGGLAADRFDMLWHALHGQQFVDGCLQYYSGDETFEDVKEASFGQNALAEPDESTLSAYSSYAMIRAARYLSGVAARSGRAADAADLASLAAAVERCLDEVFWMGDLGRYAIEASTATRVPDPRPYEDVSTMPLWLDVLDPGDPKAVSNFESVLATLGRPNGTIVTPLPALYKLLFTRVQVGVQTGMSHAYWLVNLDRMFHPSADEAFRRWRDLPTPTGFTEEAVIVDDYTHLQVVREPIGIVSDTSARYRSWEAGIVGNALLTHLTGYEPDLAAGRVRLAPHLPPEWDHDTWRGLAFGAGRFDLSIRRVAGTGREILLTTDAVTSFTVDLTVPLDGPFASASVDGSPVAASGITNRYGRTVVTLPALSIAPGRATTIAVAAS
ncbi:MAG: hypothetical protein U0610_06125 [bacterium]